MTQRKVLAVLGFTASFVLTGCSEYSAAGPCTLRVGRFDGGGSDALTPPYRISAAREGEFTGLVFSGGGWVEMDVQLVSPAGEATTQHLDELEVRQRIGQFTFDSPGQWHVQISDPVSGCLREFPVEVVG